MQMERDEKRAKRKYETVLEDLRDAIASGRFPPGQRLPSELELVKRYGVSRPTVGHALRDLMQEGLVTRRAGSGTYVRSPSLQTVYVFGLLIPDLGEGEIIEPVCQGLSQATHYVHHELLWGRTTPNSPKAMQVEELCAQFIERKVSGVFFAPLELTDAKDDINRRVAHTIDVAGIPIVLIDRDLCPFPQRSKFDLVGIDNRRAGYVLTEHLLKLGLRRIGFFGRPNSAPTLDDRVAGYREALQQYGAPSKARFVTWGDPSDRTLVQQLLADIQPEAFVCGNDRTAAVLMQTLTALGVPIPENVRIVGVDNVRWANLLPVPLTTLCQPCREIGAVAVQTMLTRMADPSLPARTIHLDAQLIVRKSCGSRLDNETAQGEDGRGNQRFAASEPLTSRH